MDQFVLVVDHGVLRAELRENLSGAGFHAAVKRVDSLEAATTSRIDLSMLDYIDSFEMLLVERIVERTACSTITCAGSVREALTICLACRKEAITFVDP